MTQAELLIKLKNSGLAAAYHQFKQKQAPPYIVFVRSYDTNISSDYKVHGKFKHYQIELYTVKKDEVSEKKIEDILSTIDPEYETSETFIESEELYQIVYQIKVIEK